MPDSAVRQQISREVKRALAERGLSARAAAQRMGVEPKTIYRWINAEVTAPLDQLERFVEAVGPIRLELGIQKEAPRPEWVEGLATKADIQMLVEAIIPTAVRQTLDALQAIDPQLLDVPAPETRD